MDLFEVRKVGKQVRCYDSSGTFVKGVPTGIKNTAYRNEQAIQLDDNGKYTRVSKQLLVNFANLSKEVVPISDTQLDEPTTHSEVVSFIESAYKLRPKNLIISELNWKYLVRSTIRGKNVMMTGPSGCGKTMAVRCLVDALKRPHFYFNLGASGDPRSFLIGNTHFSKETGTFFRESTFIKAIRTPNSIILLDELSRAHPDASNILMTVLDEGQRYLRLDEHEDSPVVKVANGVTFVATANEGREYTGTRVMDRALRDRFVTVEMRYLELSEEISLLKLLYPMIDQSVIRDVAQLAVDTREELCSDSGRVSTAISTRATVEMVSLIYDGFSPNEAAEVVVYPMFSMSGGADSERTYVRQIAQKYFGSYVKAFADAFSNSAPMSDIADSPF